MRDAELVDYEEYRRIVPEMRDCPTCKQSDKAIDVTSEPWPLPATTTDASGAAGVIIGRQQEGDGEAISVRSP